MFAILVAFTLNYGDCVSFIDDVYGKCTGTIIERCFVYSPWCYKTSSSCEIKYDVEPWVYTYDPTLSKIDISECNTK